MIKTLVTVNSLGYIAGIIQTSRTVPQLVSSLRLKRTDDLSFWMIIMALVGASLWLVYGVMIKSMPMIVTDIVSVLLLTILLFVKINFDRNPGVRK